MLSPFLQEEIFGPLLPIISMDSVEEAITFVNDHEKPLAFYVFTESKSNFQKINRLTSAGGVCHNDAVMHAGGVSLCVLTATLNLVLWAS